jgi:hypothetical protein
LWCKASPRCGSIQTPQPELKPFTANLNDFNIDANGIAGFSITPSDLTAGFQLKLAEANYSAGGQALTYARSSDRSGYTITLSGSGNLKLPQADALEVSGDLVFAGAIGGGGTRPTTALLEIVNTTPVAIAGTTFTSTGGLKVVYQEDSSRSHGVFAVQGSNSIDLERMRGLQVQLGSSGFDLAAALANLNLAPTLWTLGSIQDADGKQPFDLGLIRVEDLQLHLDKTQLLNRSVASGTSGSDPALALAQALAGSGLFTVMPLAPSLQERFTIFGLDGTPLSEVVIDITAATMANTSVSRSLALTEREKVALFTAYKRKEAEDNGDVEFETIADWGGSDDVLAEFQAFTDYFKPSTNSTLKYGSVSINEQGRVDLHPRSQQGGRPTRRHQLQCEPAAQHRHRAHRRRERRRSLDPGPAGRHEEHSQPGPGVPRPLQAAGEHPGKGNPAHRQSRHRQRHPLAARGGAEQRLPRRQIAADRAGGHGGLPQGLHQRHDHQLFQDPGQHHPHPGTAGGAPQRQRPGRYGQPGAGPAVPQRPEPGVQRSLCLALQRGCRHTWHPQLQRRYRQPGQAGGGRHHP